VIGIDDRASVGARVLEVRKDERLVGCRVVRELRRAEARIRLRGNDVGEAGKLVLSGGRRTLIAGVDQDRRALGWERVTSGSPCSFCLMLAARGPVYGERGSQFEAHGHCSCTGEPVFERGLSPSSDLADEWSDVTEGLSGKDARNAWRRHVEATRVV
jgi:hypothetical protein